MNRTTLLLAVVFSACLLAAAGCSKKEDLQPPSSYSLNPDQGPQANIAHFSADISADIGGGVDLTWDPVPLPGAAGYLVERRLDSEDGFAPVAPRLISSDRPRYKDADVEEGMTYWYRVSAVDSDGDVLVASPEVPVIVTFPTSTIKRLEDAYNEKNIDKYATCLAPGFVCTEILDSGRQRTWRRDTEISIHRKMFDPEFQPMTITGLCLLLSPLEQQMTTNTVPPTERRCLLTCWARLEISFANVDRPMTSFRFDGPAKFEMELSQEQQRWLITKWVDCLPDSAGAGEEVDAR